MRRLLFASLFAVSACSSESPVSPESAVINVQIRDDSGAPAGRNQVIVTMPGGGKVNARTGDDGTADIRVPSGGVYEVWVVPRNVYVGGTEPLTKTVTVAGNAKAVVAFTVHRAARITPDWTPEG